jgi:hypothetical protein
MGARSRLTSFRSPAGRVGTFTHAPLLLAQPGRALLGEARACFRLFRDLSRVVCSGTGSKIHPVGDDVSQHRKQEVTMTTTTMMQTSQGRPGRVFLANFIGGPFVVGALISFPALAYTMIGRFMDHALQWSDVFRFFAIWSGLALLLLPTISAALGAAVYATIQVGRRGSYSVPIAMAIAMAVALVVTVGSKSGISNAMFQAALEHFPKRLNRGFP